MNAREPVRNNQSEAALWELGLTFPYFLLYGIVKYLPSPIGDVFRWLIAHLFGLRGGWGWIREGVTIHSPWRVALGRGWTMNEGVILIPGGTITIGNHVRIAPRAIIVATNHAYADPNRLIKEQGFINADVVIGDDVWIGANVIVLPGTIIGEGCVIAAASVVTRSIDEYSVAVGSPAKVITKRGRSE
jgi:virginiamycin A acetyltransferase